MFVVNGALQYVDDSVLAHHGVKGMKWGVRKYQNPDGSLTPAGQKRYAKRIREAGKSRTVSDIVKLDKDIQADLETHFRDTMNAHRDNILAKKQELMAHEKRLAEYWKSDDYKRDTADAYRKTLDWFKSNEPEYLAEIIKSNGGKDTGLDAYHDFDTTLDGYKSEAWSRGSAKYYAEHGIDTKAAANALVEYNRACHQATKDILGKYGNMKISRLGDRTVESAVSSVVRRQFYDRTYFRNDGKEDG